MEYIEGSVDEKLVSGLVIWGVVIDAIDDDSLLEQLEALYELSYKYSQIEDHKHNFPFGFTKPELLALAAAGIAQVSRRIAQLIGPAFADWLRRHAITDAKKWAEARYSDEEIENGWGMNLSNLLSYMKDAYESDVRKAYQAGAILPGVSSDFDAQIIRNLDKMPRLKALVEEFMNLDYDDRM